MHHKMILNSIIWLDFIWLHRYAILFVRLGNKSITKGRDPSMSDKVRPSYLDSCKRSGMCTYLRDSPTHILRAKSCKIQLWLKQIVYNGSE